MEEPLKSKVAPEATVIAPPSLEAQTKLTVEIIAAFAEAGMLPESVIKEIANG